MPEDEIEKLLEERADDVARLKDGDGSALEDLLVAAGAKIRTATVRTV